MVISPGWCGSVDWAWACELKSCWFSSQSGHMPGLQTRSLVGAREATTHWWVLSFSFSFPSPLSKDKLHIQKKYGHHNKNRKVFTKFNIHLWQKKKNVKKGDIEDMYFNIVYDKSLGDIINEKLKDFPLRLGIRQGCLLLPLSFNKSLEVLARGKKGI